ncbi:hypothetical protein FGO68_gene6349 [Halteria grandinella]|uniref:Uncharacterized protein n=1 Tax=Halteria grandinella TaxID=5974 RepID=A0A8J8NNV1_HALGN|nr:hypothetical protein FGO68_gene6349 [Halteria grandinella]
MTRLERQSSACGTGSPIDQEVIWLLIVVRVQSIDAVVEQGSICFENYQIESFGKIVCMLHSGDQEAAEEVKNYLVMSLRIACISIVRKLKAISRDTESYLLKFLILLNRNL